MATDTYKNLSAGTMPTGATGGTLYTPSAAGAGAAILKGGGNYIINTDNATRTFVLWINGNTDAAALVGTAGTTISLKAGESYRMDPGEVIALANGDSIQGTSSVSGKLVYNFNGDLVT